MKMIICHLNLNKLKLMECIKDRYKFATFKIFISIWCLNKQNSTKIQQKA